MNGLLYPADEIAKYPQHWNGEPVTVFHPRQNGENVSANDPAIMETMGVGMLMHMDSDGGRLFGEAWVDEQRADAVAPGLIGLLESNEPLEVSTGLWVDETGEPGTFRGIPYRAIARNFRADHLALLPGGEGACNWADGCGIRANGMRIVRAAGEAVPDGHGHDRLELHMDGASEIAAHIAGTARTPTFDGTETTSWSGVSTSFTAFRDAYYRGPGTRPADDVPSQVANAPAAMKRWIAARTLLGDPAADNERDLIFFPVVNPGTGKLNEGALRAVISGRGAQAQIPATAKSSAQRKARNLLNRHFDAGLEVEANMNTPWWKPMVVAFLAPPDTNEMSDDDLRAKIQSAIDMLDNEGWIHFVRDVYSSDGAFVYEARGNNPNETGSSTAVRKLYRRSFAVDGDGNVTIGDDATEVVEKREYVPVTAANAATGKGTERNKGETMGKNEIIADLVACEKCPITNEDTDALAMMSVERLTAIRDAFAANDESPPADPPADPPDGEPKPADAPDGDKPKGDEPAEPAPPPQGEGDKPTANAPKPKPATVDDVIANITDPDVKSTIRRAVARDKKIKDELVDALDANERCTLPRERLVTMDIEELQAWAKAVDVAVEANYDGGQGGPEINLGGGPPKMPQVFDKVGSAA